MGLVDMLRCISDAYERLCEGVFGPTLRRVCGSYLCNVEQFRQLDPSDCFVLLEFPSQSALGNAPEIRGTSFTEGIRGSGG